MKVRDVLRLMHEDGSDCLHSAQPTPVEASSETGQSRSCRTSDGWSAPDLPGLRVADSTYDETETLLRDGIEFHIEGLARM